MSKIAILIVIALIVAGIGTGVIEVTFNAGKFQDVSSVLQGSIADQSLFSRVEYYGTSWYRKAQLSMKSSVDEKFELDVKFVEADTKKLKAALDANKKPAQIIGKTKLLRESLDRAKGEVEEISTDAIKALRDPWLKALAAANQELSRIGTVADQYKKYQEELEQLAPSPQATSTPPPLKF